MVDITPTCETVVQVEESFLCVAVWGIGVVPIPATTVSPSAPASASEGLLVGSVHVGAAAELHGSGGISVVVALWFSLLGVATFIHP
jgi:hypothetical protein